MTCWNLRWFAETSRFVTIGKCQRSCLSYRYHSYVGNYPLHCTAAEPNRLTCRPKQIEAAKQANKLRPGWATLDLIWTTLVAVTLALESLAISASSCFALSFALPRFDCNRLFVFPTFFFLPLPHSLFLLLSVTSVAVMNAMMEGTALYRCLLYRSE